jgi:hypothetical protein
MTAVAISKVNAIQFVLFLLAMLHFLFVLLFQDAPSIVLIARIAACRSDDSKDAAWPKSYFRRFPGIGRYNE